MQRTVDLQELSDQPPGPPRIVACQEPVWRGAPLSTADFARAWSERGEELLPEVSGRHGLVVIDPARNAVTLARGPHGSDPIYHRLEGPRLVCGDRLVDMAGGLATRSFSPEGLREVLNYRWCLGRQSLVEGIEQTVTGCAVTVGIDGSVRSRCVHDLRFEPSEPEGDLDHYADLTIDALTRSLEKGLDGADRPAVLLSGGTDSSILAALALRIRPDLVAVTPTWRDHPDPELPRARRYAEHLGIEHRVVVIGDEDVPRGVREVARMVEQPPRANWVAALHLCLEAVDGGCDLVLHGEGADTLFGAYHLVFAREYGRKWRIVRRLPGRRILARALTGKGARTRRLRTLLTLDPVQANQRMSLIKCDPRFAAHRSDLFGHGYPQASLLEVAWEPSHPPAERSQRYGLLTMGQTGQRQLNALQLHHGIRMVLPFFEAPIFDFTLRLPTSLKNVAGETKPILRRVSERLFPAEWARWPKLAFPMPNRAWLRGSLGRWMNERLGPESWGRAAFGDAVDRLQVESDEEIIWTLCFLDEVAEVLGVDRSSGAPD